MAWCRWRSKWAAAHELRMKLSSKAIKHHTLHIWLHVFHSWQQYMIENRLKKWERALAQRLHRRHLLRRATTGWCLAHGRSTQLLVQQQNLRHWQHSRMITSWRKYCTQQSALRQQVRLIQRGWRQRCLAYMWHRWQIYLRIRHQNHVAKSVAKDHHRLARHESVWRHWRGLVEDRRRWQEQQEEKKRAKAQQVCLQFRRLVLAALHHQHVLQRLWHHQLKRKVQLARRCLTEWNSFTRHHSDRCHWTLTAHIKRRTSLVVAKVMLGWFRYTWHTKTRELTSTSARAQELGEGLQVAHYQQSELEEKLVRSQQQVADAYTQLDAITDALVNAEQQTLALTASKDQLEAQVAQHQELMRHVHEEQETTLQQLQREKAEAIERLLSQLKTVEATEGELRTECQSLRASLLTAQQQCTDLAAELVQSQQKLAEQQASWKRTCESVMQQVDEVRAAGAREIHDLVNELTTIREEARGANGDLRREVQGLSGALEDLVSAHRDRHMQWQQQANASEQQICSLVEELASTRYTLQQKQREVQIAARAKVQEEYEMLKQLEVACVGLQDAVVGLSEDQRRTRDRETGGALLGTTCADAAEEVSALRASLARAKTLIKHQQALLKAYKQHIRQQAQQGQGDADRGRMLPQRLEGHEVDEGLERTSCGLACEASPVLPSSPHNPGAAYPITRFIAAHLTKAPLGCRQQHAGGE